MLNWLAYLTQEINSSSNNRLFIEDVYSLIVNETYPNAVDTHTQDRLKGIRQALVRYRMVDVKRDRIAYLYEQNKAQAIKAAIPNPLTVMTAVQSGSLMRLASSVVYMAINSVNSYQSASTQADLQYLQDGWELDDEADDVFYTLRSDAFDYMIDIVREYDLPGYMSLNEEAVNEFVTWKNNPNIVRRIQFLESNAETYRAFGSYWLLLAESYYENGNYAECIDAVHSYEALQTRIFRRDNEYARILPLAIVAAENSMSEEDYVTLASDYAGKILDNIGTTDWALRYYAAQTYVNLYAHTLNTDYLWSAYQAVLDNVNYLVDGQTKLNATYLAKVKEEPIPKGTKKDQETQIKDYNKLIKEKRKTELPPVSEALLVNCELLFAIADQLGVSTADQRKIDNVLHENGSQLFLFDALDNKYRFSGKTALNASLIDAISFNGKELIVPAEFVSDSYSITVAITGTDGVETIIDDWQVSSVERKTEGVIGEFAAKFKSGTADKFSYTDSMEIAITIRPHANYETSVIELNYRTTNAKNEWYEHLAVWNSNIAFQRVK